MILTLDLEILFNFWEKVLINKSETKSMWTKWSLNKVYAKRKWKIFLATN